MAFLIRGGLMLDQDPQGNPQLPPGGRVNLPPNWQGSQPVEAPRGFIDATMVGLGRNLSRTFSSEPASDETCRRIGWTVILLCIAWVAWKGRD